MPVRRLPRTDAGRNSALTSAKTKKDNVPPAELVLTPQTITRLDTQQPVFDQKMLERGVALSNQAGSTTPLSQFKDRARMFISHFIQSFNNGVDRGMFPAEDRAYYQLDVSSAAVPPLTSEEKILLWGNRLIAGDPLRVADGGAAMAMPDIVEVTTELDAFKAENIVQSNLKGAYDTAQEAVEQLRPDADSLILRIWNEVETAYSEETPASKRRKAREWGVVYVPSAGEEPSPDEFSIVGAVTETDGETGISDAEVLIQETGQSYQTDSNGDYFIPVLPPGSYTLEVSKPGYTTQTITGVVVTEGEITTQDIELSVVTANGTVAGIVRQAGIPAGGASITVDGIPGISAVTNPAGQYSLDLPAGPQVLRAVLPPHLGGAVQVQNVNIVAGSEVGQDFNF